MSRHRFHIGEILSAEEDHVERQEILRTQISIGQSSKTTCRVRVASSA
jgi:hypothetical protein